MVNGAGLCSTMVLVRLLKYSPGPAVMTSWSPIRRAEAATSTDTGAAEVHGALSFLPTDSVLGFGTKARSKRPAAPRLVSGTFVAGWSQVTCSALTAGDVIGVPAPIAGRRAAS